MKRRVDLVHQALILDGTLQAHFGDGAVVNGVAKVAIHRLVTANVSKTRENDLRHAAPAREDGTPVASPADLRAALLKRPIPLTRTFASNLMAYALGRGLEWYDMPTVRKVVGEAEANGYRMSSFILGVVTSDAFRMRKATAANQAASEARQ